MRSMREEEMKRVVNKRDSKYDVYIGRGSKWGNPYRIGVDGDRDAVCEKYEKYFWSSGLFKAIAELDNKVLGCYCAPKRCHGDFLVECVDFYCEFGYLLKSDFEKWRELKKKGENLNVFYCLVVGSRSFTDYELMSRKLDSLLSGESNVVIVSGGARGADRLAERYARSRGYALRVFPAKWDLYGPSAGYRRNVTMHQFISVHPNRKVVAFWDGKSKGTAHNFELSRMFNNPYEIVKF